MGTNKHVNRLYPLIQEKNKYESAMLNLLYEKFPIFQLLEYYAFFLSR